MDDYTPPVDREGFYRVYEEYAKSLRTWFVGYGIGGPVLILTQDKVKQVVVDSGEARFIAILFLLGVGFQIFLSLLNKWINWGVYAYSESKRMSESKRFRFCSAVSEKEYIDIGLDVGSFLAFGLATWKVVCLFS
jgi:hypothetical protein